MANASLTSPVGHYEPEVLLLAPPENPDDPNLRSLAAQLLELGISFELNEDWSLPTEPPRDLTAYKTVLIPEILRDKYDTDLNAYQANGGFLFFDKYYPLAGQLSSSGFTSATAAFLYSAWGRDTYFWHVANYLLEAKVTLNDPNFRSTLEQRPNELILEDFRASFYASAEPSTPWTHWGDTTFTTFLSHLALAKRLEDEEWLAMVDRCLERVYVGSEIVLENPEKYQELPHEGVPNNCFENMAHLLLKRGTEIDNQQWIDTGLRLARYFADNMFRERGNNLYGQQGYLFYVEAIHGLSVLYWLGHYGESRYRKIADNYLRQLCDTLHAANGLWHHWQDPATGRMGAFWSRWVAWPVQSLTECYEVLEPDYPTAEYIRREVHRSFEGYRNYQDADSGMWHLVADEPETRIESTCAQHILYGHDRLRELDVIDDRYTEMAERAFTGLKRLYYRGGFAASCRGTACGVPNYYRSRPQGFCNTSIFPAALGNRVNAACH